MKSNVSSESNRVVGDGGTAFPTKSGEDCRKWGVDDLAVMSETEGLISIPALPLEAVDLYSL